MGVIGSLLGIKRPKVVQQVAQPTPTRLEARERAERNDMLARRRGTGANRRVGFGGGEAATRGRTSLLGRSS
jgi:hypothetical protein